MSQTVVDLLRHVEREGFEGAPRALGFDDQGREVLTFIEGEVARGAEFIPEWEVELARRGFFDEAELEIAWVEEHAVALAES